MKIIIQIDNEKKEYEVTPGQTILQAFQMHGISEIHSPCGGNGTCKKCQVEVEGLGTVLSCQTCVAENMIVYIKRQEGAAIADSGTCYLYPADGLEARNELAGNDCFGGYAVACDIGTTTVVCHLLNRKNGARLATVSEPNAQRAFGGDVIARIQASCEGGLEAMHKAIVDQINAAIEELCKRAHINIEEINQLTVVGNTVMSHLFTNLPPDKIGVAPFTPESLFGDVHDAKSLGLNIEAEVYVAPCVAGYVGGDITADMLAVQMDDSDEKLLILDIGTNGEMTLGDKNGCTCCSTAAGPAFEGAQIKMGMPAAEGAISKVWYEDVDGESQIRVGVIGLHKKDAASMSEADSPDAGISSIGICGSGLVDALAVMVELEVVDETGCFADEEDLPEYLAKRFDEDEDGTVFFLDDNVYVTQGDIRKLQLAKAAIAAGIQVLLKETNLTMNGVGHLILAGGFGSFLNPKSAATIGLIPQELLPVTVSVGNAAGEGAVSVSISSEARERIEKIRENSHYIELSTNKSFTQFYMDAMYFDVE